MPSTDASASVVIAASPESVYALVTDLEVLSELADETASMYWVKGRGAAVGAVFRGANRNGWRRWTTTCTVTAAETGRRFAFDVSRIGVSISHWCYEISPDGAGCVVTESTQGRWPRWFVVFGPLVTGIQDRAGANRAHIEATLRRLKERSENA